MAVPIVPPLLAIPNVSALLERWSAPHRTVRNISRLSLAPAPAPRLDTHTPAVAPAVLVFAIVQALVDPTPPARPSSTIRSAPANRNTELADDPLVVRIDTPAAGRIVTVHGPPLVVTGLSVIGRLSPVVPS